jgi:hypothetical protein
VHAIPHPGKCLPVSEASGLEEVCVAGCMQRNKLLACMLVEMGGVKAVGPLPS